jgi:hypothetical protein
VPFVLPPPILPEIVGANSSAAMQVNDDWQRADTLLGVWHEDSICHAHTICADKGARRETIDDVLSLTD